MLGPTLAVGGGARGIHPRYDPARAGGKALELSGAVLDPRALRELYPDFEAQGCPFESPVTDDGVWFLTRRRKWPLPIVPPPFRNHGNHVASLGKVVRWLAAKAEGESVDLFPGFAASEPLLDGERVVGVRTGDKGIDRNGNRKPNYEPGIDVRAKVTILCEGPRGTPDSPLLAPRIEVDGIALSADLQSPLNFLPSPSEDVAKGQRTLWSSAAGHDRS